MSEQNIIEDNQKIPRPKKKPNGSSQNNKSMGKSDKSMEQNEKPSSQSSNTGQSSNKREALAFQIKNSLPPSIAQTKKTSPYSLKNFFSFKNSINLIALSCSIIWSAFAINYSLSIENQMSDYSLDQLSSIIAGFSLPLMFIWLVAHQFKNIDNTGTSTTKQKGDNSLTAAAHRADKIIEAMERQITNLESTSEIALNRISHLEGRFSEQVTNLFDVTTNAEKQSAAIAKNLTTEREALLNIANDLTKHTDKVVFNFEKLATQSNEMNEISNQKSVQLNENMTLQTENLTNEFQKIDVLIENMDKKISHISQRSEENIKYTDENLNEICLKIEKHHKDLNTQTSALTNETDLLCQKLDLQGHNIKDLSHKAASSGAEISATVTQHASQMLDISEKSLTKAQDHSNAFEEQIDRISTKMTATADLSQTQMANTGALFAAQAETMSETSKDLTTKIEERFSSILSKMDEKNNQVEDHYKTMELISDKFQEHIEESDAKLKSQHTQLLSSISYVAENLNLAVNKLKDQSDILKTDASSIVQNLTEQANIMANGLLNIKIGSEEAVTSIEKMEFALHNNFDKAEVRATKLFGEWQGSSNVIAQQNDISLEKLARIAGELHQMEKQTKKATRQNTDGLEKAAKELQDLAAQITNASETALTTSQKTGRAMHEYNGHFEKMIKNFKSSRVNFDQKINNFEEKTHDQFNQKFTRLSNQIMEKLQSFAIDINRYMEEDVPDEIWQQYIEGDRSIFIRRLGSYVNNDLKKDLAEKYKENSELQNYAHDYIKSFEELINHITQSPMGNSLSVAMLSSQSGKIYVALAQISGRLN